MKIQKIGIDARFYGPTGKGLGRYVQKLVEYLEKTDNGLERQYYIFLRKENFNHYHPKAKNFQKHLADYHWYSATEQLLFPRYLNKFELDLMHFTHFNVPLLYHRPYVVTIHDLILFHYPTIRNTTLNKYFYQLKMMAYRKVINSAAQRARKVIAVSEFTRQDIISNLQAPADQVVTTLEGCDSATGSGINTSASGQLSTANVEQIFQKYGIMKPYLLYVGNAYPHKNLERLCEAFNVLRQTHPQLKLVLVGGSDYFYRGLVKHILRQGIQGINVVGFVSDEELGVIYKEALLYIFPSLYEGFGLPPLEALAKGTPVVSSSRTSMPEVLGEAVEYFDPENIQSMAQTIERVIGSEKIRQEIVTKGQARLKRFSWQVMAEKTRQIYEEVLV